jgi:tripartite-type tricarboxylate transporter receptor subunit TctC
MERWKRSLGLLLATALLTVSAGPLLAAWPERPITLIVAFSPGGNTDANGRIVASPLERELGVPVRVVNRTGGGGVVGHDAVRKAEPDGYTLGYAVSEVTMMHWAGLTDLTYEDYTLLGQMTADAAAVHVHADSEYRTLQDLLDDIRARPNALNASGAGQGSPWHLAASGMLDAVGLDPTSIVWVPNQGCAPSIQDLAAGGLDFVVCAMIEAKALRDAGKVRTLAVIDSEPNPQFPDVPTLNAAVGSDWSLHDWGGVIAPAGIPEDAKEKLEVALQRIADSQEFQDLVATGGTVPVYRDSAEFESYLATMDANFGAIMQRLGLAK